MHPKNWQLFVLKAIAVFAYISCLFQWFLMVLPYVPGVIDSHVIQDIVASNQAQSNAPTQPIAPLPEWFVAVIVVVITGIMLVVALVASARLPRSIGTTAQKMTHTAAERVIPVVTHHAKLSKKKRRLLTARIIFDIKLVALAIPVLVVLFVPMPSLQAPLTRELLLLVAAFAAGWTLLLFCLQVVLARAMKVDMSRLW